MLEAEYETTEETLSAGVTYRFHPSDPDYDVQKWHYELTDEYGSKAKSYIRNISLSQDEYNIQDGDYKITINLQSTHDEKDKVVLKVNKLLGAKRLSAGVKNFENSSSPSLSLEVSAPEKLIDVLWALSDNVHHEDGTLTPAMVKRKDATTIIGHVLGVFQKKASEVGLLNLELIDADDEYATKAKQFAHYPKGYVEATIPYPHSSVKRLDEDGYFTVADEDGSQPMMSIATEITYEANNEQILQALREKGIKYESVGEKIIVAYALADKVAAALGARGLIPGFIAEEIAAFALEAHPEQALVSALIAKRKAAVQQTGEQRAR